MSYVMIQLAAQSLLVVTDTQFSDLDGRPNSYGQKIFYTERLRSLVACAGDPRLMPAMLDYLHTTPLLDIEEAVEGVAETLRRSRDDVGHHPNGHRTHIAGFPAGSQSPALYLLDADNDFEPERLGPDITWVQPLPRTFSPTAPTTIEAHIQLAEKIRADYAPGATDNPTGIGGDLFAVYLSRSEIIPQHWHTFLDHDEEATDTRTSPRGRPPKPTPPVPPGSGGLSLRHTK